MYASMPLRMTLAGRSAAWMVRPVAYSLNPASEKWIATALPTPRLAPVIKAIGIGMSVAARRDCLGPVSAPPPVVVRRDRWRRSTQDRFDARKVRGRSFHRTQCHVFRKP
jgi:hypothetical protein